MAKVLGIESLDSAPWALTATLSWCALQPAMLVADIVAAQQAAGPVKPLAALTRTAKAAEAAVAAGRVARLVATKSTVCVPLGTPHQRTTSLGVLCMRWVVSC